MSSVLAKSEIPFRGLSDKLFNLLARQQSTTQDQQIIPFLGAGVSISGRQFSAPALVNDVPDVKAIDQFGDELGLSQKSARTFLRLAVFLACSLEAAEEHESDLNDDQLLEKLQINKYPPSGGELARLFSNLSPFTAFKQVVENLTTLLPVGFLEASEEEQIQMLRLLAKTTKIANPPDALTSISSYYETRNGRDSLWGHLHSVISVKKEVTYTHRLLAAAAKQYLGQPDIWQDYLILTTNYDCLMEDALDEAGVNYVVLTTRKDQRVLVRFSNTVRDAETFTKKNSGLSYANKFTLVKPNQSMAVIFKLHGCLNPGLNERDDGIVISDNDYVDYISQMNSAEGRIPPAVNTLMQDKPLLFLGYSLSDWNVRSVFKTLRKKRGEDFGGRDYSVMRRSGDYERLFFLNNNVSVIEMDLNGFCDGVIEALRKFRNSSPERWSNLIDDIIAVAQKPGSFNSQT